MPAQPTPAKQAKKPATTTAAKTAPAKAAAAKPPAPDGRVSAFAALPDDSYLRQNQICQTAKNPTALLPVSPSSLWRWIQQKKFPAPVRLGGRVTVWQVGTIRAWMAAQQAA